MHQTVARRCFWKFRKIHRKTSVLESLFSIKLRTGGLQLYEEETPVQEISCEFCEILKNNSFKENLRTTVSWSDPGESLAFWGNSLQNYLFQPDAGITVNSLISGHHWGKDYCPLISGVRLLESLWFSNIFR